MGRISTRYAAGDVAAISRKQPPRPIYTLDAETDPFLYGREPLPFCWGVYSGVFASFWGASCTDEMMLYLYNLPCGIIYAHNGGRFDIFYLLQYIDKIKCITNNRIVSCYIPCKDGYHEVRDSYKIFPAPLASYSKIEIDYNKMEKKVRTKHKKEILSYLKDDCIKLHDICSEFRDTFGDALTIGSAAIRQLRKYNDCGEKLTWNEDRDLRSLYYYGGRVQCFEQGTIKTPMIYADVNSMYPYAMANYKHPIGHPIDRNTRTITDQTHFVTVEGVNKGALPMRMKDGGISFTVPQGIFSCTIHEYKVAVELGLFETRNIVRTVDFEQTISFDSYVGYYYNLRQEATDAMTKLEPHSIAWLQAKLKKDLYKNLLNNSYGRFAINPDNQFEYMITGVEDNLHGLVDGLECNGGCEIVNDNGDRTYTCGGWHRCMLWGVDKALWRRPSRFGRVFNVAVGASITGAARSYLLWWISQVDRPLYCDTDSIIFSGSVDKLPMHPSKLGALKVEHTGDEIHIAGKKLYAFLQQGKCLKLASKGGKLTAEEMSQIAGGESVVSNNIAPTYSLRGKTSFQSRTFRMTKPSTIPANAAL